MANNNYIYPSSPVQTLRSRFEQVQATPFNSPVKPLAVNKSKPRFDTPRLNRFQREQPALASTTVFRDAPAQSRPPLSRSASASSQALRKFLSEESHKTKNMHVKEELDGMLRLQQWGFRLISILRECQPFFELDGTAFHQIQAQLFQRM